MQSPASNSFRITKFYPLDLRRAGLRQADAEIDSASQAGGRVRSCLSLLWPRRNHCQQRISATYQRDRSKPGWIGSFGTRDDDRVPRLNIAQRNGWHALQHILNIEAASEATGTAALSTRAAAAT